MKARISESDFPEIVKTYNEKGSKAANLYIRSLGIKNPWYVVKRIKDSGEYSFNESTDKFMECRNKTAEAAFLTLDELCTPISGGQITQRSSTSTQESKATVLERMIHELISDRLLELSRYISLDPVSRTVLIDQTSLATDGYSIVTH